MRELSLHLLDVTRNYIEAGANSVELRVIEAEAGDLLRFSISDDGPGMSPECAAAAMDPFFTTRRSRRVGMGLSLLRATCERCEGGLELRSTPGHGTEVIGYLQADHIDCQPLGDMGAVIQCLALESDRVRIRYHHQVGRKVFALDTGNTAPPPGTKRLTEPAALCWLARHVNESLRKLHGRD